MLVEDLEALLAGLPARPAAAPAGLLPGTPEQAGTAAAARPTKPLPVGWLRLPAVSCATVRAATHGLPLQHYVTNTMTRASHNTMTRASHKTMTRASHNTMTRAPDHLSGCGSCGTPLPGLAKASRLCNTQPAPQTLHAVERLEVRGS